MRRILIEQARHKQTEKRRRPPQSLLEPDQLARPEACPDLSALDDALAKLATVDERVAKLVQLRFFAGLTNNEAAECLGISARTADHDWA